MDTFKFIRALGIAILTAWVLWGGFKDARRNYFVRCGIITVVLLFVMGGLAMADVPLVYWSWLGG